MSMLRIRSIAFGCAVATLVLCGQTAQGDPDPALVALQQWRDSFHNVRVVYTTTTVRDDTSDEEGIWSMTTEWIWTEDLYYRMDTVQYQDGVARFRLLSGCDNAMGYQANYVISDGGEEFLESLRTTSLGGRERTTTGDLGVVVLPLYSLWVSNPCEWLPDCYSALGVSHDQSIDVGDVPCEEYSYVKATGPNPDADHYRTRLALDPACGYLPRRIIIEKMEQDSISAERNFMVTEFAQTETGGWYPSRGTLDARDFAQEWVVDEFEFNAELDVARFAPPAPMEGTRVHADLVSYVAGPDGAQPPPFAQALLDRMGEQEPNQPVVAAPGTSWTWMWSGALGLAGIVWAIQMRRK